MTISRRSLLRGGAALGGAALLPNIGHAQKFPSKTIRVVVSFPAGATTDMLARLLAHRMTETLGQVVVVENIAGAGGSLGADAVAKAPPDGHTLLFGNITFSTTTASLMFAKRARHTFDDFVPVSVGAYVPFWFLAHPKVPADNLKEFVEVARKADKPLFYGSTGPGSIMNLCGEILKRDAKINLSHVPYKGAAPLVNDLLAGHIHFGGDQLSSSLPHVRSGKLKALAVATKSSAMPQIPTAREMGFPNLELQGWNGFLAPRGTPDVVIARIQAAVAEAAKRPDIVKRMTDVGAEPSGSSSAEMREMLRQQIAQVRPAVEELKLVMK